MRGDTHIAAALVIERGGADAAPANDTGALEIPGETPAEEALALSEGTRAVDIRFAKFSDGRGFSLAAILRERGYRGSIRAVGQIIPDQAGLLARAGFDSVKPDAEGPQGRWALAHPGSETAYQPGPGASAPSAFLRRAAVARKKQVERLNAEFVDASPDQILAAAADLFEGRIAMLSSFGAEAAVGLALLARSAPDVPVLFLDTKRHFAQTLSYRDRLAAHLGLKDLRVIEPDPGEEAEQDGDERLWRRDANACCDLRKVRPLARALNGFEVLITGRKRYHGGERETLQPFEFDGERIKVNPFAAMGAEEVAALYRELDLPPHPLVAEGYPSIGCWPCTAPAQGGDLRAGRWAGQDRDECGIHRPLGEGRARYRLI